MADTIIKEKDKIDELLDTIAVEASQLVLHNDEQNTFEWVIQCLIEICGHQTQQAEQCAMITHFKGKCSVKQGEEEEMRILKDGLNDRGLNATVE